MSEIDWSKAPDGATHCNARDSGHKWWMQDGQRMYERKGAIWCERLLWPKSLIPRPPKKAQEVERDYYKQAAKTLESMGYTYHGGEYWKPPLGEKPDWLKWDGEGLPPVGVECEAVHFNSWVHVEVVAHVRSIDGTKAVFQLVGFNEWNAYSDPSKFRPLKSQHEQQREGFVRVVCDIAAENSLHRIDDIAAKVFDDYLSRYTLEPKQ